MRDWDTILQQVARQLRLSHLYINDHYITVHDEYYVNNVAKIYYDSLKWMKF